MMHQLGSKVWANRSQQTAGNVTITFPELHARQSKTVDRFGPVSIQRVKASSGAHQQYYDEYITVDREKEAATGKWVLHAIAARETHISSKNDWNSDNKQSSKKKKHSFQSRKSSKVQPIENSTSKLTNQFVHTQLKTNKNHNINQLPHEIILSPTTIDDGHTTHLSSFSSTTSIDDNRTTERSSTSSQIRSNSHSRDRSTDKLNDSEDKVCISKRVMIIFTIVSIIIVIGIIIAVFVTIFVGKNQSTK